METSNCNIWMRQSFCSTHEPTLSEKTTREEVMFSKYSHILGSAFAYPCQRRVGGGEEEKVDVVECFTFFPL